MDSWERGKDRNRYVGRDGESRDREGHTGAGVNTLQTNHLTQRLFQRPRIL